MLAVFLPLLFAIVLRNPSEHDNVFLGSKTHLDSVGESPLRVLLVTAHPDDESLFFAPTLISLLSQIQHNGDPEKPVQRTEVYSLCLSVGDADGLGDIRRQELMRSLNVLGIDGDRQWIVDSPCV